MITSPASGRKPSRTSASRSGPERVLAIDIGGTKFAATLIDQRARLLMRTGLPVGPDPTTTLASLVASTAVPGITAVGIGSAGPINAADGTVSPLNIPAWQDFPIVDAVAELVPGVSATLAGDAQCMASGEWWRGGHGGVRALMGVVVSTGVGAGLVQDGMLILGPTGNAGHLGHISVDPEGPPCVCGARGCVPAWRLAVASGVPSPEHVTEGHVYGTMGGCPSDAELWS